MFRKNVAGQHFHFQGIDSATGGIKSGVTWTVRRCIDGTFAAATGTVTEDGTAGWYKFAMSQADTNGNNIGFNFTGTGAIPQTVNIITTAADPTDTVRLGLTALPNAAAEAAGGLYTRGTGAGQINQPANGQVDANAVRLGGTTQTGRDVGASVLLSSGTGTGQLDFTSGVVKANLAQILGTALTETAGQIAAAFKKFFDKAAPTGTINSIPDAVAGAASGLALVGSNVGTATSVTGAVGSVTADVGITQAGADKVWASTTRTLSSFGSLVADIATAVWGATTRLLTAGTNIVLAKGVGVTGFNDLSAADVNAEVDTALADYDGPTHAELTSELADADDAVLAAIAALDSSLIVRKGLSQGIVEFSNNTIILDAGAVDQAGFYAKNIILITGGTGVGQVRRINSYGSGRVVVVDYIWTTIPDNTSEFAILPDADVLNVSGDIFGTVFQLGTDAVSAASLASDAATEIANRIWEDDNSVRTTADSAGNKLRQALILYEGN